ncbi:hypothetical protein [Streptomyces sp. NPDC059063]|uniref:hypothetical protein n=1 Tax=unclassified Streptomyces TaxID=2593676 RepID=UPI0036A9DB80
MGRHHHGYVWVGNAAALVPQDPRRAGHPDFAASPVPPLELAHWLLKSGSFVRGTFTAPEEATAWVDAAARPYVGELLPAQLASAGAAVVGGEDFAGGWYVSGQRFLAVHLVACSPHRFRPEYGCPVSVGRGSGRTVPGG